MSLIFLDNLSASQFPTEEDDQFEFKSSQTPLNDLKKKLDRAASGFANSGGGCFICGIDKTGNADGGLDKKVKRQDLRDWIDQIVSGVSPTPSYTVRMFDDPEGRGTLAPDKVIAAISIHPSLSGPHMAADNKFYIRAGAHTLAAGHALVEALWARRHVSKPVLSHVLREKPTVPDVIQLGLIALTEAPALDVRLRITPANGLIADFEKSFPIRVPVIDRSNGFFLDATLYHRVVTELTDDVKLTAEYRDLAGNEYTYVNHVPLSHGLSPIRMGHEAPSAIARSLEKIEGHLAKIVSKR